MSQLKIEKLVDFLRVKTKPDDILEFNEIEGEDVKTEDILDQNLLKDEERRNMVMKCDQCGSEFNIELGGGEDQLCYNCKLPMRKKSRYEAKKTKKKARKKSTPDSGLNYMFDNVEEAKKKKKKKKMTKAQKRGTCIFPSSSSKVKDDKDHFPINNVRQARNALARAGQYDSSPPWYKGSLSDLKKAIRNAVKRAYPSIEVTESEKVIDTSRMIIDLPIDQCLDCGYVFERDLSHKAKPGCPKCSSENLESIYHPESTTTSPDSNTAPARPTFIKEFDDKEYKVVASGIADKATADKLAREKRGDVAEDPADEGKFIVIVKENIENPNEAGGIEEKEYAKLSDFSKEQQALIQALTDVQKQINSIKKRLKPIENQKKSLSPQVLEAINSLSADGVRIGKILMYVQKERFKDPTYSDILVQAREKMSKQFVNKLEQLGEELKTVSPEVLKVKTEASVKGVLSRLVDVAKSVSKSVRSIEKMLGMSNTAEARTELLEAMFEDKYEAQVDVEVYSDVPGEYASDVTEYQSTIKYKIEVDAREWGVKDILISIIDDVEVNWIDNKEGESDSIVLKPEDISINWMAGKHIYPVSLVVWLTPEKTVKNAELTFYYIEM